MNKDLLLCKAKTLDGEWVEGYVVPVVGFNPGMFILKEIARHQFYEPYLNECYDIDPETVCRCTGLKAKHKTNVYHGDIIEIDGPHCLHGTPFYCESIRENTYSVGDRLVIIDSKAGVVARDIKDYELSKDDYDTVYDMAPNGKKGGTKSPVRHYELWNMQSSYRVIGNIHDLEGK